jgi:YjbE family integral membrane protein
MTYIDPAALLALAQVVLIDVTLAGDNAIVVGMAVAGLPAADRRRAIFLGVATAALIRVGLSLVAVRLLAILGLTLAGGCLLLWVCWKMYRELRAHPAAHAVRPRKSLRQAVLQIALADISMSLDNVLAVAGAAHAHVWVLIAGLALSVLLMGIAANMLAKALERWRWIAWTGLAVVVFVAIKMILEGSSEVIRKEAFLF